MRRAVIMKARNSAKGIAHSGVWKHCLQMLILLLGLCLGTGMTKICAKAAQASVSHGNLIYEGKWGSASLYAADIRLLEEKISTIPEQCFDPVWYGHTHNWEYSRINERTHTRHCAECGDANDLTGPHRAESWERDTIFYEGNSYPAKRYTCVCGYQWRMEMRHTLIYEAVDEVNHRGRCALDETSYCQGCEPSVEEHYAWYYEMDEEEAHHVKICIDCGYQIKEACSFDETDDESLCVCGRSEEQEERSETPETGDTPETPDEAETGEPPETSDEPGTEDAPETPDEAENEDAPEPPDESGEEDTPEIPDTSETITMKELTDTN